MFKLCSILLLINLGVSFINCVPLGDDPADHVKVEPVAQLEDDAESGNKAFAFDLPSFLAMSKPPMAQGNATQSGQVQSLFSTNNNTLIAESGPNSQAIASLTSTSYYGGGPTNQTVNNTHQDENGGWTDLNNMAGQFIEAYESTHAYAVGDEITFVNHGISVASADGQANGWGASSNNGGTGGSGGWGAGAPWGNGGTGGWKNEAGNPQKPDAPQQKPDAPQKRPEKPTAGTRTTTKAAINNI